MLWLDVRNFWTELDVPPTGHSFSKDSHAWMTIINQAIRCKRTHT